MEQKRAELESQLEALREERQLLTDRIADTTISDEHIHSVTEAAAAMQDRLEDADFALKRKLVELLNISCSLAVENDEKVVYVHWYTLSECLCTQCLATRGQA